MILVITQPTASEITLMLTVVFNDNYPICDVILIEKLNDSGRDIEDPPH